MGNRQPPGAQDEQQTCRKWDYLGERRNPMPKTERDRSLLWSSPLGCNELSQVSQVTTTINPTLCYFQVGLCIGDCRAP